MAVSARTVKFKRDADGMLTGRQGTVYDVNIKYKTYEGVKSYQKRGIATKKEALKHEAEMRVRLSKPGARPVPVKDAKRFLADYLTEWLNTYGKNNLRPNSYNGYLTNIRAHIIPHIGNITLQDLTARDLDDLYTKMSGEGLAQNTIKYVHRTLGVALEHARRYRYIERNPARDILTRFIDNPQVPDPYDTQQMRTLLEGIPDPRWKLIVTLGGLYGMRRNEILGLKWKHVHFDQRTFDIVEQLPIKAMQGVQGMAAPLKESYSIRTLPITAETMPYFKNQLSQIRKDMLSEGYQANDLVICKPDGSPLSESFVSHEFQKYLIRLDLPKIRFHDLRHSAATNMHELTGDFYSVGEILGQSLKGIGIQLGVSGGLEAVTERYVDVRIARKRIVLEKYHRAVVQVRKKEEMER